MPSVKPGESQKDYVSRCIPYMMKEKSGMKSDQAAAICYSLYKKHESIEDLVGRIDEWMVDVDIESLQKHIKKYGDLIAASAEQIYHALDKQIKKPSKIIGFEFRRDSHKAEITISTTGDAVANDKAIRVVMRDFGYHDGWILAGASYAITKPNLPQVWHVMRNF